mmetsp:Transcript_26846/g.68079  ORF Transcript_26846/g.68079 Transcript_26846/m.68079 type:complete len:284 (-) Transcript_26846:37-888(-)
MPQHSRLGGGQRPHSSISDPLDGGPPEPAQADMERGVLSYQSASSKPGAAGGAGHVQRRELRSQGAEGAEREGVPRRGRAAGVQLLPGQRWQARPGHDRRLPRERQRRVPRRLPADDRQPAARRPLDGLVAPPRDRAGEAARRGAEDRPDHRGLRASLLQLQPWRGRPRGHRAGPRVQPGHAQHGRAQRRDTQGPQDDPAAVQEQPARHLQGRQQPRPQDARGHVRRYLPLPVAGGGARARGQGARGVAPQGVEQHERQGALVAAAQVLRTLVARAIPLQGAT